jgi:hypothetical protein
MQDYATRPSGSDVRLFSDVAIPYGAQVTIFGEPEKAGGRWVTQALAPALGIVTIQSDRPLSTGERFIIVRRSEPTPAMFLHLALLVEHLEELAEQAEERVLKALRTSPR